MPGSDDQYDQVHTYSQDHAGKSKTTKPAVREIGRDGAPVQLFIGQRRSTPRTPPSGVVYLFVDDADGLVKQIDDTGTVLPAGGQDAPADASYVTTASESALSNETVASQLTDVYGSPIRLGGVDLEDDATDGNVIWDESAGHVPAAVSVNGQAISPSSVDTEEADITNETFIRATRGSNNSSNSSGSYINVFDGESDDNRNEFNSSAQFVPDKSGEYEFSFRADIRGSTSAGDELRARVYDMDAGSSVLAPISDIEAPDSVAIIRWNCVVELSAGTTYEVQVTNQDSTFEVNAANTDGTIKRSLVA